METLPRHIEDTVQAVAAFHVGHRLAASALERFVVRITAAISAPAFVGAAAGFVAAWIGLNVALPWITLFRAFDPPPFAWLQWVVTAGALFVTLFILAAQAHENVLAEQRAQLTLHLAMISERKVAKLIALIEELRRDSPHVEDRIDADAVAMGQSSDPQVVLEALRESSAAREQPIP
jgi:uncharacterized membrane protein